MGKIFNTAGMRPNYTSPKQRINKLLPPGDGCKILQSVYPAKWHSMPG